MNSQGSRRKRRLTLPKSEWPKNDRDEWEKSLHAPHFLVKGPVASRLADSRIEAIEFATALWLGFLRDRGELDPNLRPGARVTEERINAFIDDVRKRHLAGYTVAGYVWQLYSYQRILTRGIGWDWLKAICVTLWQTAVPKNIIRNRIVPTSVLVELGIDIMEEANQQLLKAGADDRAARLKCAINFRDGLMIVLLALRPLRRRNFARMKLGKEIIRAGKTYFMRFSALKMKNRKHKNDPLPKDLAAAFDLYIDTYRKILLVENGKTDAKIISPLWLSSNGSALSDVQFYYIIATRTKKRFGHIISPHLFRHCAASSIADLSPGDSLMIAEILGDSSFAVMSKHYIHMSSSIACNRHVDEVMALRNANRSS